MLTATEEAQVKALIAQNAALLSLASSEPTIISKLAATKVSLADLTAATSLSDADLFLVRQGTAEKSAAKLLLTPDATLTSKGIVELATSAETVAGTDSTRAVTPAGLMSGFTSSLTSSGWQKLPSGLIIQWGERVPGAIIFPITFPNALRAIALGNSASDTSARSTQIIERSSTGFTLFSTLANDGAFYIAIGN